MYTKWNFLEIINLIYSSILFKNTKFNFYLSTKFNPTLKEWPTYSKVKTILRKIFLIKT